MKTLRKKHVATAVAIASAVAVTTSLAFKPDLNTFGHTMITQSVAGKGYAYGGKTVLGWNAELSDASADALGGTKSGGDHCAGGGPTIVAPPVSAQGVVGDAFAFVVTVQASGTLSYQWKHDGTAIAGATASNLSLASAAMTDAGSYTVVVTDTNGSVESSAATLSMSTTLSWDGAIDYRALQHLVLANADPAFNNESTLTATLDSGESFDFAVSPTAMLHLLAPSEKFANKTSSLRIENAAKTKIWTLTLNWASRYINPLQVIQEGEDTGVTITAQGTDAFGLMDSSTASLSYQVQGAPALSGDYMYVTLSSLAGDVDVSSWFAMNEAGNQISLLPAQLPALLSVVSTDNTAQLSFSASSTDWATTVGFSHVLTAAQGVVNLSLVNADGSAATGTAGTNFVARSLDSGYATLRQLDSSGKAQFGGLPAGSYYIEEVALHDAAPMAGFAELFASTDEVGLAVTVTGGSSSSTASAKARAMATVTRRAGAAQVRPHATSAAVSRAAKADAARVVKPAAFVGTTYQAQVQSSTKDQLIEKALSYSIPMGTQKVHVRVEVYTSEFPNYVGSTSKYNDEWRYNVTIPGGTSMAANGKVNDTHKLSDTISEDKCVDVSAVTKTAAATLTGTIGAKNVFDGALPTRVTVYVGLNCDSLIVTSFTGSKQATDAAPMLIPLNSVSSPSTMDGNLAGRYLSIPMKAQVPAAFGIPALLKFEPTTATISEVDLLLRSSGGDIALGTAYLSQGVLTAGQIKFASLRLLPVAHTPVKTTSQLVVVLKGKLANGTAAQSSPTPIKIDSKYADFWPMYLASEMTGYNVANRFGTHTEAGGDSWGTAALYDWITGYGLHYNDFSAANIKQTATGRSVLDHAGHSDGQQADLRYWDGAGGFTDALGGANQGAAISALAAASLVEVKNQTNPAPNTEKLVAWINENRTHLTSYTTLSDVRRVYIGNAFIAQLLVSGVYPTSPTTKVPKVGAWVKPTKVLPQDSHLDHWHVNTSVSGVGH